MVVRILSNCHKIRGGELKWFPWKWRCACFNNIYSNRMGQMNMNAQRRATNMRRTKPNRMRLNRVSALDHCERLERFSCYHFAVRSERVLRLSWTRRTFAMQWDILCVISYLICSSVYSTGFMTAPIPDDPKPTIQPRIIINKKP